MMQSIQSVSGSTFAIQSNLTNSKRSVTKASLASIKATVLARNKFTHTTPRSPLRLSRRQSLQVTMVMTESVVLDVGFKAPEFELLEPLTGKTVKLSEYTQGGAATVIMIICNHCPFVVHLKPAIIQLAEDYQKRGVRFIAISSNSVETHPQDGPEHMAVEAKDYPFPYVFDATQEVAKAYQGACTPEFYIFNGDLKLTYHGQFDDSRPGKYFKDSAPVTGKDIRAALDATLAGTPVPKPWRASIGCNVKFTPGNEPAYFLGSAA